MSPITEEEKATVVHRRLTPKRAATTKTPDKTNADESKDTPKKKRRSTKRASPGTKSKTPNSNKKAKSVRQRREERIKADKLAKEHASKKRKLAGSDDVDGHGGNIICAAPDAKVETKETPSMEDFFWEVEKVIGRRNCSGRVEYLIRWKGCSEEDNTWEPAANLCDTAMTEALRYVRSEKLKMKQREEDERKLGLLGDDDKKIEEKATGAAKAVAKKKKEKKEKVVPAPAPQDQITADIETHMDIEEEEPYIDPSQLESIDEVDQRWKWTDAEQVKFREVKRVDISKDPVKAGEIITEARINGTPIVLVGHVGWANFAKRWIRKKKEPQTQQAQATKPATTESSEKLEEPIETKMAETSQEEKVQPIPDNNESKGAKMAEEQQGEKMPSEPDENGEIKKETPVQQGEVGRNNEGTVQSKPEIETQNIEETGKKESMRQEENSQPKADTATNNDKGGKTIGVEQKEETVLSKPNIATENDRDDKNNERDQKEEEKMPSSTQNNQDSRKKDSEQQRVKVLSKPETVTKNDVDSKHDKSDLLDLSDSSNILDIKKMMEDIGDEDVPIVKRNYDESNPIHGVIPATRFFKACWPNDVKSDGTIVSRKGGNSGGAGDANAASGESSSTKPPKLYLHQWQFPLSDTAGRKLCHNNEPLPPEILGEDLLKHWIDLPQCKSDSPLQYLFMGREETMSRLHKDAGGLLISIAPIVGQKECVLVHRSDGSNCLYHLSASLTDIDLHSFPLLSQARVWRTVIKPGEILLMPQGTYHQCRNLTPCLSYSRFYLDTVNLLPFFQSLVDGDAPELDHDEVLWNATTELIRTVDSAVDEAQARVKKGEKSVPKVDESLARLVDTLRSLRNIVRELARREAVRNAVKGRKAAAQSRALSTAKNGVAVTSSNGSSRSSTAARPKVGSGGVNSDHEWSILVDDIDMCLHEFRFRRMENIPTFRPRRVRALKNALPTSVREGVRRSTKNVTEKSGGLGEDKSPVVAYDTDLDKAYLAIRNASAKDIPSLCESEEGKKVIATMSVGDHIHAKIEGKRIPAEILKIDPDQHSAYLSYEDYPSLYDEFQPYEQLRKPTNCGDASEIPHDEVKPGIVVLNRWGEKGEEYRAVVQYTTCETMYKVRLDLGRCIMDRWISASFILDKVPAVEREKYESEIESYKKLKFVRKEIEDALGPKNDENEAV